MKVGKAIYNILSRAIPVQQNIGFSTDTFAPSGVELVTDGNFPNSDNWNVGTGWSIANNKASVDANSTVLLSQAIATLEGKTYKISGEVSNYVDGTLQIQFGGGQVISSVDKKWTFHILRCLFC